MDHESSDLDLANIGAYFPAPEPDLACPACADLAKVKSAARGATVIQAMHTSRQGQQQPVRLV